MDELIDVMRSILLELQEINSKLDDIRGSGFNSIDDICSKLENISGFYSLSDVCDRLDTIDSTLSCIDTSISMLD